MNDPDVLDYIDEVVGKNEPERTIDRVRAGLTAYNHNFGSGRINDNLTTVFAWHYTITVLTAWDELQQ